MLDGKLDLYRSANCAIPVDEPSFLIISFTSRGGSFANVTSDSAEDVQVDYNDAQGKVEPHYVVCGCFHPAVPLARAGDRSSSLDLGGRRGLFGAI